MKWATRIINRMAGGVSSGNKRESRPPLGKVFKTRPEDSMRDYPSTGLTPSRLAAILREADAGAPGEALPVRA